MRCKDNRRDSLFLLNVREWRILAEDGNIWRILAEDRDIWRTVAKDRYIWSILAEDRDIWRQRSQGLVMRAEMPLKEMKKKNLHVDAYIKGLSYRTSSKENLRTA